MSWTLKPGVRQDSFGRYYQVLVNSRGREDVVFVKKDTGAPRGYTVPIPPEPERKVIKAKPAGPQAKRLHVVEMRRAGTSVLLKEAVPNSSNGLAAFIDSTILRFDGKNWLSLFPPVVDWHVQYHLDEETPVVQP